MTLDPDFFFQIAPLGLYLLPSFIVDRLFFRFAVRLSRWIIYVVPLLAWVASLIGRSRLQIFMGMGNFLIEPLLLAVAPIAFLVFAPSARRLVPRLAATIWPEVGLILSIAFAVTPGGLFMPA